MRKKQVLSLVAVCLLLPILKTVYVSDIEQDMTKVYASEIQTLKEDNRSNVVDAGFEVRNLEKVVQEQAVLISKMDSTIEPGTSMYDWNADLKCPTYIGKEMFRIWAKKGGEHSYVPYCIAWYESRFNPATHALTSAEDSRGLFQVNVKLYAHRKNFKNRNQAFDPRVNMEYQFNELVRFEKKGIAKGLSGVDLIVYVAKYGQRPKWDKWIEEEIRKAYAHYNSNLIK